MWKPVAQLAAVGVVGLVLAKLATIVFPVVLGMLIGVVIWLGKLLLIAALIWFGYQLFRKLTERPAES